MRTFVAIEIDDAIRAELANAQKELKRAGAAVRWAKAANVHLTLKFLGEVSDEDVGEATRIIRECAAETAPFDLYVCGVGAFPSLGRPRVLFARAGASPPALEALAGRLNERLAEIGVEPERRRFQAHLTLGRLKGESSLAALADAVSAFADTEFGRMRVEEIVFMMSELRPRGPIYTPLEKATLCGPGTETPDREESDAREKEG